MTDDPLDGAAGIARRGGRITLWHSSSREKLTVEPYLHCGSKSQALSRRRNGYLFQIEVSLSRIKRIRDRAREIWEPSLLRRYANRGFDAVIYLNRFEVGDGSPESQEKYLAGIAAMQSRGFDPDQVSDAQFRRFVPEARDSLVVLDPFTATIKSVQPLAGTFPEKPA